MSLPKTFGKPVNIRATGLFVYESGTGPLLTEIKLSVYRGEQGTGLQFVTEGLGPKALVDAVREELGGWEVDDGAPDVVVLLNSTAVQPNPCVVQELRNPFRQALEVVAKDGAK